MQRRAVINLKQGAMQTATDEKALPKSKTPGAHRVFEINDENVGGARYRWRL